MPSETHRRELLALLQASHAEQAFADDVQAFANGRQAPSIVLLRPAPRIKVLRVLTHMLHAEPELTIASVRVDGTSGCADFRGQLVATTRDGEQARRFHWDCRWRAECEGWIDPWGGPDQIRAAREFEWRCISEWEPIEVPAHRWEPSALEERA